MNEIVPFGNPEDEIVSLNHKESWFWRSRRILKVARETSNGSVLRRAKKVAAVITAGSLISGAAIFAKYEAHKEVQSLSTEAADSFTAQLPEQTIESIKQYCKHRPDTEAKAPFTDAVCQFVMIQTIQNNSAEGPFKPKTPAHHGLPHISAVAKPVTPHA